METQTGQNAQYLIGQLAADAGVGADTVRFYEKQGLLAKPSRSPSGYRLYGEAALRRLRFIRKAQTLGFSLDEIKRILSLRGQGPETCECVISMAEASLEEVETKLRELQAFRDGLAENLDRWRTTPYQGGPLGAEFCALIENSQPSEGRTHK